MSPTKNKHEEGIPKFW